MKTDGNGVINVNLKDGNAGDSVVKFTGDIYAKTNESSINLALKGKNSQWTGRSLNESADSENVAASTCGLKTVLPGLIR